MNRTLRPSPTSSAPVMGDGMQLNDMVAADAAARNTRRVLMPTTCAGCAGRGQGGVTSRSPLMTNGTAGPHKPVCPARVSKLTRGSARARITVSSSSMTSFSDHLQEALGTAYRLERELTGAGMRRVFVALDQSLGRKVVVK